MISCFHLTVHRPSKSHVAGHHLLLDEVSVKVSRGEFVELSGPAGSGKSVLCSLFSLRRRLKGSKCIIAGRNLDRLSPASIAQLRRQVGSTTQAPRFLESRSVLENLLLPSVARAREKGALDAARALIDATALQPLADAPAAGLSGSERRLLGIFRALVGTPELVILDGGLEDLGELRADAARAILRAHAEGSTILMAAREPTEISAPGVAFPRTQLLRLEAGKLRVIESSAGDAAGPKTAGEAGYVGRAEDRAEEMVSEQVTGSHPTRAGEV